MWWHTVTHGWGSEGETGEWRGSSVPFTLPRNMVYPLLPLIGTPRLPVFDWTDAPADLNGLVLFAERRNLVSAHVPPRFNWPLQASTLKYIRIFSSRLGQCAVWGVGLRPLACWNCGFESRRGLWCLSLVSFVCYQVEISMAGRSLV